MWVATWQQMEKGHSRGDKHRISSLTVIKVSDYNEAWWWCALFDDIMHFLNTCSCFISLHKAWKGDISEFIVTDLGRCWHEASRWGGWIMVLRVLGPNVSCISRGRSEVFQVPGSDVTFRTRVGMRNKSTRTDVSATNKLKQTQAVLALRDVIHTISLLGNWQ